MRKNITEIYKNIFQIKLPLPNNPLRIVNTYLIKGEPSLLIDTAFDNDECYFELIESLKDLKIDLSSLNVLVTHLHSDHSALSRKLKEQKVLKIFASKEDSEIINHATKNDYWIKLTDLYNTYGFPINPFINKMRTHLGWEYHMSTEVDFGIVNDGDKITVGDYSFDILKLPGHSPGHLALYEKSLKFLFSSDHILGDITPVIAPELNFENPLSSYIDSLKRIKKYDVALVLTGHRNLIEDMNKRVDGLIRHHNNRLEECRDIFKKNKNFSYYDIAKKMSWDLKYGSFDNFPGVQKWFATGEAASHMIYLKENDLI